MKPAFDSSLFRRTLPNSTFGYLIYIGLSFNRMERWGTSASECIIIWTVYNILQTRANVVNQEFVFKSINRRKCINCVEQLIFFNINGIWLDNLTLRWWSRGRLCCCRSRCCSWLFNWDAIIIWTWTTRRTIGLARTIFVIVNKVSITLPDAIEVGVARLLPGKYWLYRII